MRQKDAPVPSLMPTLQISEQLGTSAICRARGPVRSSFQGPKFLLGGQENREILVRILPKREHLLVGLATIRLSSYRGIGARQAQLRKRVQCRGGVDAVVIKYLLKFS